MTQKSAKSQEKAVHRASGPGGMGAGPAIKVPLQLVTGERWQGDGGDTCLHDIMCRGAH